MDFVAKGTLREALHRRGGREREEGEGTATAAGGEREVETSSSCREENYTRRAALETEEGIRIQRVGEGRMSGDKGVRRRWERKGRMRRIRRMDEW